MENKNQTDELICRQCGKIVNHPCNLHYSQGVKVCAECKEINKESDERDFDNFIRFR